MRKSVLLLVVVLLVGALTGCDGESASPTPTQMPTPVSPTETTSVAPPITPSDPASCVVEPFEFPTNPNIPPVSEQDYVHGPEDAPITFIEYAEFQ